MPLTPANFAQSFKAWNDQRNKTTACNYAKRVMYDFVANSGGSTRALQQALKEAGDIEHSRELEDRIKTAEVGIPKWLFTDKNIELEIKTLLKRPTSNNAVKQFYNLVSEGHSDIALVFRLKGYGNWVIHNISTMDNSGSYKFVITTTGTYVKRIEIQPLNLFAKEVKNLI